MDKKRLIEMLKNTTSLVDFYKYKEDIIVHLEGPVSKKSKKGEKHGYS